MDPYAVVEKSLTDWIMVIMALIALATSYARYKRYHNAAIIGLILATAATALSYFVSWVFNPIALYRVTSGRAVFFGVLLAIALWNVLTLYADKRHGDTHKND